MTIYLNNDYYARPDNHLLGYVGEHHTRMVYLSGSSVPGADSYSMVIEYSDGVKYEIDINNERFIVTDSILRSPQKVHCQILAKAAIEGTNAYMLVKKSNVFTLDIAKSIEGEPAPVPDYEQTLSLLDSIKQLISGGLSAAEVKSVITAVLAQAIAGDIEQEEN